MTLSLGIIGCGLIGRKRAGALGSKASLVACSDRDLGRAQDLSRGEVPVFQDWRELLEIDGLDAVIVATAHDSLAEIGLAVIESKKSLFLEKPGARNLRELMPLIDLSEKYGVKVRVGFNHRYHRAMLKAKEIISSGSLGGVMFIRGRYGHGGRLGYDQEWRADPVISGGGELIDQGPHLIDLSRWYLGKEFVSIVGFAPTYFWKMPVDDNGFMMLKTNSGEVAFLHVSCTEWKNTFSLEIYCKYGKLEISGLGGSYGTEKLTLYKMLPEMGPPETISWEFPMADNSWEVELSEFVDDIVLDRRPSAGLKDAYESLSVIEQIYQERY
jgi:predicted dehydrogenase